MILKTFADYPPRKRMGILAIILGVLAVFAGSPYQRATAKVNIKEIAMIPEKDISAVEVDQLADWIIKGKSDYRLVDLRDLDSIESYNIPTSECIPVSQLLDSDLMRNEKIILYGNDDKAASQAWFILKAVEFKGVYLLEGGMESWKNNILFPKFSENPTPEQKNQYAKMTEVSKYFGGQPQTGTAVETQKTDMPKLKAPQSVNLKKPRKKKKREGC